jgi:hypothetical protein
VGPHMTHVCVVPACVSSCCCSVVVLGGFAGPFITVRRDLGLSACLQNADAVVGAAVFCLQLSIHHTM